MILTRVIRRSDASRTVGRVTRIIDDGHVTVAWGNEARSEQPAELVEFTADLRAAS